MFDNGSIRVLVVAVVREGGVSNAEITEQPQVGCRVADLMQAFNAHGGDDFALAKGPKRAGAVRLLCKVIGEGLEDSGRDIDLVEGVLDNCTLGQDH